MHSHMYFTVSEYITFEHLENIFVILLISIEMIIL